MAAGRERNEFLASCYRTSLVLSETRGLKTIAFPAISTGAYGFPVARATAIAVKTVLDHLSGSPAIMKGVFVCHWEEAFRMYTDAIGEIIKEGDGDNRQEGFIGS